jgi:hypothetical protein
MAAFQKLELNQSRRGLVLAGGGAKGAWQFGVLQALRDAGVIFDAVSGTSVGALNGALWCANLMDVGELMWSSMSLRRVFLIRPWLAVFAIFGLPVRVFRAVYYGYSPDDTIISRVTIRIIEGFVLLSVIILGIAALGTFVSFSELFDELFDQNGDTNKWFGVAMVSLYIFVPGVLLLGSRVFSPFSGKRRKVINITGYLLLVIIMPALFVVLLGLLESRTPKSQSGNILNRRNHL